MSQIIHRSLRTTPVVAVGAQGAYITDVSGKRYLDACGGAAVSCLGHAHPDVLAAMHRQIDQLAYAHTSFFTSDTVEQLAEQLVRTAPDSLNYAYFVSGGSEAVETALKLARQYFVEIGQPERTLFIARKQSYHGNTLGALAVGGNEWRRRQFAPLLMDVVRVSACNEYRDRAAGESQQQYTERLLGELEAAILDAGPEKIIGFCAETVVGATTGATPPTPGYLQGVRRLCDKYGILYIADEVMCGMGRTGTLYAFEQDGIVPDIVTIAKGLGGATSPLARCWPVRKSFPHYRLVVECSSMVTPISATRRQQQLHWQCNRLSSGIICWNRCSSRARICSRHCMTCWASYLMLVIHAVGVCSLVWNWYAIKRAKRHSIQL
ncbi:aminotransferase class-III protein [Raoultella terrigena]|uniref:Aminotransferase class-III protein n=1 Tax=Raoultella terrigena TaxID=577 RepID=A0A7Z8Z854_RAOTE|nr:aminotransferase class-III protein [Raoultella terrigena]